MQYRPGEPTDIPHIQAVESAAGELFRSVAMDQIAEDRPPERRLLRHMINKGQLWVAIVDSLVVGYAMVIPVGSEAHLDQVSVDPTFGRRGIGTSLVQLACEWAEQRGCEYMTLFTYADVPWNQPYYRKLGFTELDPNHLSPEVSGLWQRESASDLHNWHRVVMELQLARR